MRTYHKDGTVPTGLYDVFVFGSNLAGVHGAGAAKEAQRNWGAIYGLGIGRMGSSYAIPTKDKEIRTLPLSVISIYVEDFIRYATHRPDENFFVTRVGCVLAGYRDEEIAPLFASAPENCSFAEEWKPFLE